MNMKTIVAIAAILVVLGAGYAVAGPANGGMMGGYGSGSGMMGNNAGMMQGYGTGLWGNMMGNFGNMMRNYGDGLWNGMMGGHRGMMGGYGPGGMMGYGTGGCGGYGSPSSAYGANATPITIEKAKEDVQQYLASTGNTDLKLSEIIEFDNHFYAGVKEKSTGKHAFELLVNKYTGAIAPEMGPNMMWNTKYGHMNWNAPAQAVVTEEQALKNAQEYLDKALPGTKTGDADDFYGYYTIEVLKDGKIYGMLSVNNNTGAVWYHNWHGAFVKILEVE